MARFRCGLASPLRATSRATFGADRRTGSSAWYSVKKLDKARFETLLGLLHRHQDALSFSQVAEARALKRFRMYEDIFATRTLCDESEPLCRVIPFDGTCNFLGCADVRLVQRTRVASGSPSGAARVAVATSTTSMT